MNEQDFINLNGKLITQLRTLRGYMEVIEYILYDYSYLHIIRYHYNEIVENNLPKSNVISFYKEKDKALEYAEKIGEDLLKQNLLTNIKN